MLAHDLTVIIDAEKIVARPLSGPLPVRHVQAAVAAGRRAPATLAALDALREGGRRRAV